MCTGLFSYLVMSVTTRRDQMKMVKYKPYTVRQRFYYRP